MLLCLRSSHLKNSEQLNACYCATVLAILDLFWINAVLLILLEPDLVANPWNHMLIFDYYWLTPWMLWEHSIMNGACLKVCGGDWIWSIALCIPHFSGHISSKRSIAFSFNIVHVEAQWRWYHESWHIYSSLLNSTRSTYPSRNLLNVYTVWVCWRVSHRKWTLTNNLWSRSSWFVWMPSQMGTNIKNLFRQLAQALPGQDEAKSVDEFCSAVGTRDQFTEFTWTLDGICFDRLPTWM